MINLFEAEKISEAFLKLEKIRLEADYVENKWSAKVLGKTVGTITLNGVGSGLDVALFGAEVETIKKLILSRLTTEAYKVAREAGIALNNEEWFIIYHEEATK